MDINFNSSIACFLNSLLSAYAQDGAHTRSRGRGGSSDSLFDKNLGSIWIPVMNMSGISCQATVHSSRTIFMLSDMTGIDDDELLDIF